MSLSDKLSAAGLILLSLVSLGSLFENVRKTIPVEVMRLAFIVILVMYLGEQSVWVGTYLSVGVVYFLVSVLWLFSSASHKKAQRPVEMIKP
jgi:apolipoprotein N-acyltransferase